jgi:hypothetical protein
MHEKNEVTLIGSLSTRRDDDVMSQLSRPGFWPNSYLFTVSIALLIGVLTIVASLLLDRAVHHLARPVYASDVLVGTLVALLSGAALLRAQIIRQELLTRMQITEDVNHHVRNALAAITLTTSLREDPELIELVKDASERIDWVLSEILSGAVSGKVTPKAPSRWRPGRQIGVFQTTKDRLRRK